MDDERQHLLKEIEQYEFENTVLRNSIKEFIEVVEHMQSAGYANFKWIDHRVSIFKALI